MKHMDHKMEHKWTILLIMAVLSFVAMYILMYAMVDRLGNVYTNLNQFYMAALMTGAMMLIEVGLMRSMYARKVIIVTAGLGIAALVIFFMFIRSQTGISDREFLRSMISHHGAALLMCENAALEDAEIKSLCAEIIADQQSQIDWMQSKLSTLK